MARKLTPLQEWRRNYAGCTFIIRAAKQAARNGHTWGDFKRPAAQSMAAYMRVSARKMMERRPEAARLTAQKWEADARKRAIKLGHPIPNTIDPKDRVGD